MSFQSSGFSQQTQQGSYGPVRVLSAKPLPKQRAGLGPPPPAATIFLTRPWIAGHGQVISKSSTTHKSKGTNPEWQVYNTQPTHKAPRRSGRGNTQRGEIVTLIEGELFAYSRLWLFR